MKRSLVVDGNCPEKDLTYIFKLTQGTRCSVAQLECIYDPPKTWFFFEQTSDETSSKQQPHEKFKPSRSPSVDGVHENGRWLPEPGHAPCVTVFRSQQETDAFDTWVEFVKNHTAPLADYAGSGDSDTPDVMTTLLPQIAHHAMALRQAMIANGIIVQSLRRKELGAEAAESTALMLKHASRGLRELAMGQRPIIEVVLTAWTFWQLDLMCGNFQSALVHLQSAMKISEQRQSQSASDALAYAFIRTMVAAIGENITADFTTNDVPPALRKARAMPVLEQSFDQIVRCIRRVMASRITQKSEVLRILDLAGQEARYCLSRYMSEVQFERWSQRAQSSQAGESSECSDATNLPGIFSNVVADVDEYVAGRSGLSLDQLDRDVRRATHLFLVTTAEADLALRHITMDLFNHSRQIRLPACSRPPSFKHLVEI